VPADQLELRRITPDDWRSVRHRRLDALLDEPTAYCERWTDAAALDDGTEEVEMVRDLGVPWSA
jgi:hypothetical protein